MSSTAEITLFHWNILELSDDLAIFVGLRQKSESVNLYFPYNCSFRSSTSIESFDINTGIGVTQSGRVYICTGKPSDPNKLIRLMVRLNYEGLRYQYRYKFTKPEA